MLTTSPTFITIISILFLAVSVLNFVAQEKETRYLHDEMRILTSRWEDTNKGMQAFSYKLNSVLQEIENIKSERLYFEKEIESVKKQINWLYSRLNDISEKQRIKVVGIGSPIIPYEINPQDEKESLTVEDSLERQNIVEHFQKAVFYQRNGELSKALQEYEGILEIDPLNAEAHNNMGLLYQQKGEYNKALLEYRKAVSLKPDYNKARSNIGTVLYRQGHFDAAGLEFKFILKKEPENVYALTNLAIIYKETGEIEKASNLLLKALDINEEFPEAHYNLALILEELGNIDEAIIHYRAFLKYSHDAYPSLKAGVLKRLEVLEKK